MSLFSVPDGLYRLSIQQRHTEDSTVTEQTTAIRLRSKYIYGSDIFLNESSIEECICL